MELHTLNISKERSKKRLGRGHGSGRGKTSGRGTKGQKARGSVPLAFEGGALALIKRLPFMRGKGRNKSFHAKPITLPLSALGVFQKNAVIDHESLIKYNLIDKTEVRREVKILGDGEVQVALTVKLPVSQAARKKIEDAQGKIEVS